MSKKGEYKRISAICPFYKRESNAKIVCCGIADVAALHSTFKDPSERKRHTQLYCDKNWQDCVIAQMLSKKYK